MPSVPLALQLYSLREIAPADPAGTFANLAQMGFTGVEFAGYYGLSGQDLRHLLDAEGLQAAGAHVGLDSLLGEELEKSAEFHAALGNQHLVVPGLAPSNPYPRLMQPLRVAVELLHERLALLILSQLVAVAEDPPEQIADSLLAQVLV